MELTYKDVERDIERWMEAYGTPDIIGGAKVLRGSDKAEDFVLESYFENKAYDALVTYVIGFSQAVDCHYPLLSCLNEVLVAERQIARINRLWQGVLAKRKISYYEIATYQRKIPDKISAANVEQHKNWVLTGLEQYAEILHKLGESVPSQNVLEELQRFREGKRIKPKGKPDPRQIDEHLFWSLIADARNFSSTVSEQIEFLCSKLEMFKGSAIRQFSKILAEKLFQSYHWDIWALAFLAQDGCSDDAFEGFRAWLILQGKETFSAALADVNQIPKKVPSGLSTDAQQLLSISDIAYERRTGKPMTPTKPKLNGPYGVGWEEEDLPSRYPELCRFYDRLK